MILNLLLQELYILLQRGSKRTFFSKDIKLFESVKQKLKNASDKINPIEENSYASLSEIYNKKGNKLTI